MTLEGGFLWTRVRLEKQASCIKGSQYWCSASMLSFYMTVCQLLTTWIEDSTYFSYFSFNFWNPSGLYLPSLKIILVIIMIIIYIIMFMVLTSRLRVHLLMQIMLTDWQTNDSVCQYVFICLSPFVCLSLFVSMFVCVLRLVVLSFVRYFSEVSTETVSRQLFTDAEKLIFIIDGRSTLHSLKWIINLLFC